MQRKSCEQLNDWICECQCQRSLRDNCNEGLHKIHWSLLLANEVQFKCKSDLQSRTTLTLFVSGFRVTLGMSSRETTSPQQIWESERTPGIIKRLFQMLNTYTGLREANLRGEIYSWTLATKRLCLYLCRQWEQRTSKEWKSRKQSTE